MGLANESQATPLHASLMAGVAHISNDQVITFQKYKRTVLPVDRYVFWVRDGTVQIVVKGSLHYSTDQQQNKDETIGVNRVTFITENEIQPFNSIADNVAWIGSIDSIRFAFTSRQNIFKNSGMYRYDGEAIYPVMYSQIIEDPNADVSIGGAVASNSLPAWLSLNAGITLYPSFLIPSNLQSAYGAVHIDENDTEAIQGVPYIDSASSSYQLMKDKVEITLYGVRHDGAVAFLNKVMDYFKNNGNPAMGLLSQVAIKTGKRSQSELGLLAQQKIINFEVSYLQNRMQTVSRQLILECFPNITLSNL